MIRKIHHIRLDLPHRGADAVLRLGKRRQVFRPFRVLCGRRAQHAERERRERQKIQACEKHRKRVTVCKVHRAQNACHRRELNKRDGTRRRKIPLIVPLPCKHNEQHDDGHQIPFMHRRAEQIQRPNEHDARNHKRAVVSIAPIDERRKRCGNPRADPCPGSERQSEEDLIKRSVVQPEKLIEIQRVERDIRIGRHRPEVFGQKNVRRLPDTHRHADRRAQRDCPCGTQKRGTDRLPFFSNEIVNGVDRQNRSEQKRLRLDQNSRGIPKAARRDAVVLQCEIAKQQKQHQDGFDLPPHGAVEPHGGRKQNRAGGKRCVHMPIARIKPSIDQNGDQHIRRDRGEFIEHRASRGTKRQIQKLAEPLRNRQKIQISRRIIAKIILRIKADRAVMHHAPAPGFEARHIAFVSRDAQAQHHAQHERRQHEYEQRNVIALIRARIVHTEPARRKGAKRDPQKADAAEQKRKQLRRHFDIAVVHLCILRSRRAAVADGGSRKVHHAEQKEQQYDRLHRSLSIVRAVVHGSKLLTAAKRVF